MNHNIGNYKQYENFIDKYGFNYSKKKELDISALNNSVLDTSFYNFYKDFSAVEYLVHIVESNIIPGSGIIIPPYFEMMRDLFSKYNLFLTDKHDGNLILGGPLTASPILERMKALLGNDYTGFPPLSSGMQYSSIRSVYINLSEDALLELNNIYPLYRYIITEKENNLKFKLLDQNNFWKLYEISNND